MISINALTIARLVQTLFNFYSFLVLAYCCSVGFPFVPVVSWRTSVRFCRASSDRI